MTERTKKRQRKKTPQRETKVEKQEPERATEKTKYEEKEKSAAAVWDKDTPPKTRPQQINQKTRKN